MNRAQRAVLKLSLATALVLVLYPPYVLGRYPYGHHLIFSTRESSRIVVDVEALLMEFVILYLVVGVFVLLTASISDAAFDRFRGALPSVLRRWL